MAKASWGKCSEARSFNPSVDSPFYFNNHIKKCPIKTTTWVCSDTTYSYGSGSYGIWYFWSAPNQIQVLQSKQQQQHNNNNNNSNRRRTRKYAQVARGEHEKFVYLKLAEHKRKAFKWTFHIPSTLWPTQMGSLRVESYILVIIEWYIIVILIKLQRNFFCRAVKVFLMQIVAHFMTFHIINVMK